MNKVFSEIYKDKTVLVTGHTGFKGSWLCLWLEQMGAKVFGYAREPETIPNHWQMTQGNSESNIGDLVDREHLQETIRRIKPDIVFHLAAQALVRYSYHDPIETYNSNVMGTAILLDACRNCDSIRAIVVVSSDKCYDNKEWAWGYRESDALGGYDPYSSSKGCTEIVADSFRNSFFPINKYGSDHQVLVATARAGNVIGGGDWSKDRLIPDLIKSASQDKQIIIRSPDAIRPWQHVLEPLSGYLLLGQKLLEGNTTAASAWNFGPQIIGSITVGEIANHFKSDWSAINFSIEPDDTFHEAKILRLDCSKAINELKWNDVWPVKETLNKTLEWYKRYITDGKICSTENLKSYIESAKQQGLAWAQ